MAKAGEAYGFLKFRGTAADISDYIPAVRNSADIPPAMLFLVTEGAENCSTAGDSGLVHIAQQAEKAGMTHMLKAALPFTDNKGTASELKDIIIQLYQTPLYEEGEDSCAKIVYREDDGFKFLE